MPSPKTLPQVEHKSFHLEIKEIDADQGIIRGYLSTFNNVDYGKDRVRPGAFKKTIAEALQRKTNKSKKYLWPVLWSHDSEKPIGGVIDAIEDTKGLLITAQLDISTNAAGVPNNPLATSVFSGMKAGFIDEMSMGYKALQKDYAQDGVRDLKEVQLWEASVITANFAMNNEAAITDVKSRSTPEHKDFNDRYRQEQIQDWMYSDFQNLVCALKAACMDIFAIGDEPEADVVNTILEDQNGEGFISALKAWVQKGIELDVSNYLQDPNQQPNNMYYMSRNDTMEAKAGRTISKATAEKLSGHAEALQSMAMQHKAMADMHYKALMSASNDLQTLLGTPENFDGEDGGKSHHEPLNALNRPEPEAKATPTEDELLTHIANLLKKDLH